LLLVAVHRILLGSEYFESLQVAGRDGLTITLESSLEMLPGEELDRVFVLLVILLVLS